MRRSVLSLLVVVLVVSILAVPGQTVSAQDPFFDAEINKSFSPISIPAGGISRLSVTIFNPNPLFSLTNASWADNLIGVQPGLTIANPVGLTNNCGGSVSAPAGGTALSLSGGTVPPQVGSTPGECTVSINVTSTSTGNKINTIPAGELSSTGDGNSITNTTPASATLNVTGTPRPSINKSFSPATIWAGRVSRLSIVITNNEIGRTLTQASLTDNLPANVFLADPVSPQLTGCGTSAALSAVSGGTSVTLTGGTVTPNSSCTIRVNVTSNVQGRHLNEIPASALQTQEGVTNAVPATAQLTVREIGITKQFEPDTLSPGGTTTLRITLQNPHSTPYTGVGFTDNLPAPMTAVSVTANSCGGPVSITPSSRVQLSNGTIPAGSPTTLGTCTILVQVTVPAGTSADTLQNVIPAGSLTTDQGVMNLSRATANVTISGTEVTGTKSFSPATISPGENSRLRIEIVAPNDTDLTNFSITDRLPSGIIVSDPPDSNVTGCGGAAALDAPAGATIIVLTNGSISAGTRCRIDVDVTGNTPGVYANTIPPENIRNDEDRVPGESLTSDLTISGVGGIAIDLVKGFEPLTVFGGSASTMSVQLINPGNVTLTDIAFTDNMPSGMILADSPNFEVGTCGGALSGTPGSNSFSFSGGSLPGLTTCTLTLSVTMTVNGNLTNTIPAGAVTTANGVTNADPVRASLTNLPGASVSKAFSPNPIPAGSYSRLTITIRNTGTIGLTGMGLSDSLPAGLEIAGGSRPAPVNNCGGTLTAVAGTQLIQLADGVLGGSAVCRIIVSVTGRSAGNYRNTIPVGALRADPNTRNTSPTVATLRVTDGSSGGGGGRGGRGGAQTALVTGSGFLIPVTGFAPGRVTKLDAFSRPDYAGTGLEIEIPVIRVDASIAGVSSKDGRWDVAWLQDQVGWLNGTAYHTWEGNSVLTAHVVNADGKPGVFYRLNALGVGEYIFVESAGYRYTYKVVSNEIVQ